MYLSGVNGAGGEGIQGRQVCVFSLHRLLCGWTVVDAAHNFGTHKRTCKNNTQLLSTNHTFYNTKTRSKAKVKSKVLWLKIKGDALTFCDNALNTHHAAQQPGGQGPGGDMLGAKAALQADEKLLVLLGVGAIHKGHQVLQSPLERQQLLKRIVHQPEERTNQTMD